MESRNLQEQNFYNKKQTSAYCENYVTEPLLHLRTENRRQKRQREQRFNTKRKIFTYGRKCMQSLNFDEQEFLHHNQKNNSSKSYLHDYHRGSNTFRERPFHTDFVSQKIVANPSVTLTTEATNFLYDEDRRSPYDKDDHSIYHTRVEEEKQRRRQEWLRQQERERQHEKLKQQKILEYERKRAEAIKLAERKSSRHNRSKSDSKSPTHHHYRGRSTSNASKSGTLYEKSDESSSRVVSLFKDSQGIQISSRELNQHKVIIRRNISVIRTVSELRRDIVHPEDVIIERRKGEGCKPIFDRNEIKKHTIDATNKEHFYKIRVSTKDQFSQTSESFLKELEASQSS